MRRSPAALPVQRLERRLWIGRHDLQQRPCRAGRPRPALLPVLQRAQVDAIRVSRDQGRDMQTVCSQDRRLREPAKDQRTALSARHWLAGVQTLPSEFRKVRCHSTSYETSAQTEINPTPERPRTCVRSELREKARFSRIAGPRRDRVEWQLLGDQLGELPGKSTPSEVGTARASVLDYIGEVRVDRHGKGRGSLRLVEVVWGRLR